MEEEERSLKDYILLGVRVALAIALIIVGKVWLNEANFDWYVNLIVMGVAYAIISYDVFIKAAKNIVLEHEFFDECGLMILASLGAFVIRVFGPDHNEYMEGVLVMLLYQIGELFEDLAADKSRDAITKAIDLRKEKARVVTENGIIEKHAEELTVGDVIMIGAGMKILADGEIVEGSGEIDESSLTGEFNPVFRGVGESVNSGSILSSGTVQVKVARPYSESTVAKLLDMIENSSEKKSKSTRFIDSFSKIYAPVVTLLAVLIAVLPPLFIGATDGAIWARWLYSALSFLIVSCPCAIVISVPLAYFAGLGLASKNGVLVKGAEYFDKLNAVAYVGFDKTGTLTEGKFEVKDVVAYGVSKEELLAFASAAESSSTHPIAKAIVAKIERGQLKNAKDIAEVPGKGVRAVVEGKTVLVGKHSLLLENDVKGVPENMLGIGVYVSIEGSFAGYIEVQDALKATSKSTIEELHQLGVKTVLLSGDKTENVESISQELGLSEHHGDLLPEEKLSFISQHANAKEGMFAFVGDGINDAPSLRLADVGIAMGGLGSDAAVNSADCVIMNDDPHKVVSVMKIAKKTKHRAIFNIVCSLSVKAIVMILAIVASAMGTWSLPLFVSVFADTGLSMLIILSSLLLGMGKTDSK